MTKKVYLNKKKKITSRENVDALHSISSRVTILQNIRFVIRNVACLAGTKQPSCAIICNRTICLR